jgi:hemerythrin-like domain-containing protein
MQYTEVVSQSTSSPQGSPTIRYSENRNSSSASTSDKTSIQQQNFIWEPFLGSVVTAKSTEGCSSIVSYPVSMRREFVNIRMQRSFIFDEEKCTWKWFKTWRLPEIRLVVNEQESFLPSFVRLSVVCPGQDLRWFEEVSLLGTTQVQLVNGEAKFTRLRFGATSSSYEGRNFHLLIAFFSETAYCLGALISTGFVVYARGPNTASFQEGVRFTQAMKSKSLWFSPEQLTRPFMKKVRNEQGIVGKETIEDNVTGLVRYFQAPNIRFKCRDPIFLAMRFSSVVVLFLNSSYICLENSESYAELFFKLSEFRKSSFSDQSPRSQSTASPICLYGVRSELELSERKRTILWDSLESCQDEAVRFVRDVSVLPKNFIEVTNISQLRDAYERFFSWYTNIYLVSEQVSEQNSVEASETREPRRDSKTPLNCDIEGHLLVSEQSSERMVPCTGEGLELISPHSVEISEGSEMEVIQFVKWFRQFHSLLKQLLEELTMSASQLVMKFNDASKSHFHDCFRHFQRALTLHTHIEDSYGFAELMKQRPLIFEAYRIDHKTEEEELERIISLSTNMQIENVGELFLRVSSFSSLLCQHMDKEEKHLLPCAVQLLSKTQLKRLVIRMNGESQCLEGWKDLS